LVPDVTHRRVKQTWEVARVGLQVISSRGMPFAAQYPQHSAMTELSAIQQILAEGEAAESTISRITRPEAGSFEALKSAPYKTFSGSSAMRAQNFCLPKIFVLNSYRLPITVLFAIDLAFGITTI
jgi:hypothetical protein